MSSRNSGGASKHDVFNKDHLNLALRAGIHKALTAIEEAINAERRICKTVLEWLEKQAKENARAKSIHERIAEAATPAWWSILNNLARFGELF